MPEAKDATSADIIDGLLKSSPEPVIDGEKGNKAPAAGGQPIFQKDLELVKTLGCKNMGQLVGAKVNEKAGDQSLPLNFGSKAQTGHLPDDVRQRLFHLKKTIHNLEIQAAVKYNGATQITPDMYKETDIYKFHLHHLLKAYNVTDFSNWIPTATARFYFEEYTLPFLLADLFDMLPMDTPTMEVPGDMGLLEGHEETDTATFGQQSTSQDKYTVQSRNNVVHTIITEDLLSDNAPQYIDKLRRNLMSGIIRAFERCILNGDTAQSSGVRGDNHMDTDTRALALNQTFSKAFDGIRKKAFANEAALGSTGRVVYNHGGDTPSKDLFAKLLEMMGPLGTEPDQLAWVMPSRIKTALITGAIPELFTAFAFGGIASNVTGIAPPVFGILPTVSGLMREDLNASGVYQSGQSLTTMALINKTRFAHFMRQAVRMWAAPSLPSSDVMLMTAKGRHTWNGNPQNAKEIGITLAVNIGRAS